MRHLKCCLDGDVIQSLDRHSRIHLRVGALCSDAATGHMQSTSSAVLQDAPVCASFHGNSTAASESSSRSICACVKQKSVGVTFIAATLASDAIEKREPCTNRLKTTL